MIEGEIGQMTTARPSLAAGMYMRVSVEEDRDDADFRDYRIGLLVSVNPVAQTALLRLLIQAPGESPTLEEREYALESIERCRILPDTPFTCATTGRTGRILMACDDDWPHGKPSDYFVELDGQITRICEADLMVAANRQDPDPYEQLRRYEFHHPMWKQDRDAIVASYNELRHATFGIEDLVGSRIVLLAHQAEVIATVLSDPKCCYVLADEVGLGKTVEACVILRGLRRWCPTLRALIVVPSSLVQQWQNELNDKFWLDAPIARAPGLLVSKYGRATASRGDVPGVIVAAEDLAGDEALWEWTEGQTWDLLIVDEAHQLRKSSVLYDRVRALSAAAERVLLLSATPIQHRAEEYLALLAVLDPERYDPRDVAAFRRVLDLQDPIRRTVAFLAQALTPDDFDPEEFEEEFETILAELHHDTLLAELAARVTAQAARRDRGLAAAREALAYLSENYRVEHRVIRNRRAHLEVTLPARALDTSHSYDPGEEEDAVFEGLTEYLEPYLAHESPLPAEYARVLLHAASSSPHALLDVLEAREASLRKGRYSARAREDLTIPAAPRAEQRRIARLIAAVAPVDDEASRLERLARIVRRWHEQTAAALDRACARWPAPPEDPGHRLVQALLATSEAVRVPGTKMLVFSSWPQTLDALLPRVARLLGSGTIAQFTVELDAAQLREEADRFQAREDCRLLFTDELGGEGRNFQVADRILHLDLPWTPAQLEQRIGRVDRLGRSGRVLSVVPVASDRLEHDLFRLWQEAFQLFTRSMSGLEIALEDVQDEVRAALRRSPRHGLAALLPAMVARATRLREEVEKERLFEEGAINRPRRQEFRSVSERYRDGELLRGPFLRWANLAGLHNSYSLESHLAVFRPHEFSLKSMYNAKFFNPPNMEEALARSGRLRDHVIRGTFDRDIAVRREDYVFFAPGTDPWTDALVC